MNTIKKIDDEKIIIIQHLSTMGDFSLVGAFINGMEMFPNPRLGHLRIVLSGEFYNVGLDPDRMDVLIRNLQQLKDYLNKRKNLASAAFTLEFSNEEA